MSPDPADEQLAAWRAARDFADLCELGARFVEGDLDFFPGWLAAGTDPESDDIAPVLARFNRRGLLTLASHPGRAPHAGFGGHTFAQRAFVAGFATPSTALALGALTLDTELLVSAYPATERGGFQVPVGRRGDEVTSWAGHAAGPDELEIFAEVLAPEALGSLRRCRYLSVVDPAWERRDLLWTSVERVLAESAHGRPDAT